MVGVENPEQNDRKGSELYTSSKHPKATSVEANGMNQDGEEKKNSE